MRRTMWLDISDGVIYSRKSPGKVAIHITIETVNNKWNKVIAEKMAAFLDEIVDDKVIPYIEDITEG